MRSAAGRGHMCKARLRDGTASRRRERLHVGPVEWSWIDTVWNPGRCTMPWPWHLFLLPPSSVPCPCRRLLSGFPTSTSCLVLHTDLMEGADCPVPTCLLIFSTLVHLSCVCQPVSSLPTFRFMSPTGPAHIRTFEDFVDHCQALNARWRKYSEASSTDAGCQWRALLKAVLDHMRVARGTKEHGAGTCHNVSLLTAFPDLTSFLLPTTTARRPRPNGLDAPMLLSSGPSEVCLGTWPLD